MCFSISGRLNGCFQVLLMLLLFLLLLLIYFSFEFIRYFGVGRRDSPLHIYLGLFVYCYKVRKQQGSVIDTIKYHTCPRIPNGKVTKITIIIPNKSQKVSPFPSGDHKAAMNRRYSMANTRYK